MVLGVEVVQVGSVLVRSKCLDEQIWFAPNLVRNRVYIMHKCCVKFLCSRSRTLLKQTFSDVPKHVLFGSLLNLGWVLVRNRVYIMHKCYVKFLCSRSRTLLKQTFSDVPKHVLFGSLLNLGSVLV